MVEPRIQYVQSADGTQIAYTTLGEGHSLVVPANAWGDIALFMSPSGLLRAGLEALSEAFEVTIYDGRGSGASDRNVADFSLAARLADLEAVADAVGIDRFSIFAIVHATHTAVAYATRHPERVERMALVMPYAQGSEYYASTPMVRAIKTLAEIAQDNWEFFTLTLTNWMTSFGNPELAREIAALYRDGMNPRDYMSLIAACEQSDIRELLPKVSAPTLVIRDPSSPFSTPEITRRVSAAIPSAQTISVGGSIGGYSPASAALAFLRGEEPGATARPAAASVITVLFTDIVGHTEMMRRLGDEKGREVLREHERITRDVLARHSGTEVKTTGDGFMASFGSVTKAVECALALQRAFDDRDAGAGADHDSPLRVRCGLNAGEPIEDEGDLFGSSVILASRIAAKAQGGEIFASLAVRELCAGKGFLFADLGDHELRGFEDPVKIFEVKWKE
jgi:class 3 adenylate cyclase